MRLPRLKCMILVSPTHDLLPWGPIPIFSPFHQCQCLCYATTPANGGNQGRRKVREKKNTLNTITLLGLESSNLSIGEVYASITPVPLWLSVSFFISLPKLWFGWLAHWDSLHHQLAPFVGTCVNHITTLVIKDYMVLTKPMEANTNDVGPSTPP